MKCAVLLSFVFGISIILLRLFKNNVLKTPAVKFRRRVRIVERLTHVQINCAFGSFAKNYYYFIASALYVIVIADNLQSRMGVNEQTVSKRCKRVELTCLIARALQFIGFFFFLISVLGQQKRLLWFKQTWVFNCDRKRFFTKLKQCGNHVFIFNI